MVTGRPNTTRSKAPLGQGECVNQGTDDGLQRPSEPDPGRPGGSDARRKSGTGVEPGPIARLSNGMATMRTAKGLEPTPGGVGRPVSREGDSSYHPWFYPSGKDIYFEQKIVFVIAIL